MNFLILGVEEDILRKGEWEDDSLFGIAIRNALMHFTKESSEQKPCKDTISRQAVFSAMRKNHRAGGRDIDGDYVEGNYSERLYDDIVALPPITLQS